ncbi:DUF4349 domain-containing protein [Patescibacteria group bacterium]|nr:MAG: DUF4349 domain-containing protein [Patescibacteria group bacterium]
MTTKPAAAIVIAIGLLILIAAASAFPPVTQTMRSMMGLSFGGPSDAFVTGSVPTFIGGISADKMRLEASEMMGFADGRGIPSPVPPMMGGSTAAEVDQKLIKTGSLDLVVDSVPETASKLSVIAAGKGGFVQDSSVSEREDGTHFGSVTVRVPAAQFEAMVSEAKELATLVRNESVNGQDVTEQYTDLQARIKNARAQETAYLDIMRRAGTIEDILAVQRELSNVRAQIESMEGSLKYLENATSYSTLSVSLSEEPSVRLPSKEFRPLSSLREAAQALITVLQGLVTFAIWFVVIGAGMLIPLLVVVYVAYRPVKRFFAPGGRR